MAYIGTGVEYALHCLLWLVAPPEQPPSSRDLADIQGVPVASWRRYSPLEKAGIVESSGGIRGGYRLARAPQDITVLDVVDAVEGEKSLFECQEVRGRCALFEDNPPKWASRGVCGIHAVMLNAQRSCATSCPSPVWRPCPRAPSERMTKEFLGEVKLWFSDRQTAREDARITGIRARSTAGEDDE